MTYPRQKMAAAGLSVVLKKVHFESDVVPLTQWVSSFDSPLKWVSLTRQNGIEKVMPVVSDPNRYNNLLQVICQQIPYGTGVEWQGNHYDIGGVEFESDDVYGIQLLVTFETPLKTSIERASQALVFKWIGIANSELAKQIHDQSISPFTLACEPLSSTKVRIHIATLQKGLLSPLLWGMSQDLGQSIQIVGKTCQLNSKVAIAKTHTYESLSQAKIESSTVSLTFLSPTSFKQDKHIQPFPLPHSVFGGLLKKWNKFAPSNLAFPKTEWKGWVAAYNLKTKIICMEGGPQIGAVGWIRYKFSDPEQARIANILAHFADFAGVGRKTAMGMGQTRLKETKNRYFF